mmetsp:Transcript_9848/g.7413  ORF Transcript_9848/g.7413 Transcript_9848/m.7413 type:complete len:110 (+) Transcript_9848:196-525(+)
MQFKKQMAVANLKMKNEIFSPNIVFLNGNFLVKELHMIAEHPELFDYVEGMGQCAGKNGMNLLVCMMRQNKCNSELVDYCKCLVQYQRSKFICKVPKLELKQCYAKRLH